MDLQTTTIVEPVKTMEVPLAPEAAGLRIPEVVSATEAPAAARAVQVSTAEDLSRLFFYWPVRPDGVFEPLFCKVAHYLLVSGLPGDNLKQALMLNLGAISGHLRYPLAILLAADDPLTAARLIEQSLAAAPSGWTISFDTLTAAQLFVNEGAGYRNKCIVCQDPEGLTKVSTELDLMLTRGYAVRQEVLNTKYATRLEEVRARGYPAFIGIASKRGADILKHPSILKIPVSQGSWGTMTPAAGDTPAGDDHPAGIFRIRKCFKRLKRIPVAIPFRDEIAKAITASGVSQADVLNELVAKVISLVTIINQPPPATIAELASDIYEVDEEVAKQLFPDAIGTVSSSVLTATKIDYYIARRLLENSVKISQTSLTERQMGIFQTLKRLNWAGLQTSTIPNAPDIKKLSVLAQSSPYWVDREKLYEEINKRGGMAISLTTVNNELLELCNMGVVGRAKSKSRRQYGYFVMTLDVEKSLTLPAVSQIVDPVYGSKQVKVVDPLTGQVEMI